MTWDSPPTQVDADKHSFIILADADYRLNLPDYSDRAIFEGDSISHSCRTSLHKSSLSPSTTVLGLRISCFCWSFRLRPILISRHPAACSSSKDGLG